MKENRNTEDPPEDESPVEEKASSPPPSDASAENVDEPKDESPVEEEPTAPPPSPDATEENVGEPDNEQTVEEKRHAEDTTEDEEETYTIDDAVNLAGYKKFQKVLTFLAGMGWLADAFEVIILSLIGDLIACEWKDMKRWQNAVMTSAVFFGMALGAPIFGMFADKYGRRTILALSMFLLFVFGAASALSPSYPWIVTLRGFMGFSLGGIAQSVTLCCEYYPAKVRGRAGFYLSYYWAAGSIGVVGMAWIIMKYVKNWRWLVFIASVPALIVLILMKWYPESARFYLVSNQREKAVKQLEWMARMNKAELPKGTLVEADAVEERGRIIDLLHPKMRRQTLLFWYIWLSIACAYYGVALITPYIITNDNLLDASKEVGNKSLADDFNSPMPCVHFTDENFGNLLWTTAAEFPGILLFAFTVECCDRKVFLGSSCLLLAFLLLLLMLKMEPQIAIFLVLFVCRALVAAVFQLLFIMTTEAFPTTLRASAMGTGSGCARIGGLLIPYLAQVAVIAKPIPSMMVLSAVTALAGVAAFLLPLETRGVHMKDAISQPFNNNNPSPEDEA